VKVGEGCVVAVADPSIIINSMIVLGDNMAFMENTVGLGGEKSKVVIDQSHLPIGPLGRGKGGDCKGLYLSLLPHRDVKLNNVNISINLVSPLEEEVRRLEDLKNLMDVPRKILDEVSKVVVGKEDVKEILLTALLSEGHVLIEGMTGTAKTLLARTFAQVIGGEFKRIQFYARHATGRRDRLLHVHAEWGI